MDSRPWRIPSILLNAHFYFNHPAGSLDYFPLFLLQEKEIKKANKETRLQKDTLFIPNLLRSNMGSTPIHDLEIWSHL
jgi:hypothetical protein